MVKTRLLVAAALAALLGAAPVMAQTVDQGTQPDSELLLKKKKKGMNAQEQQFQDQDQFGNTQSGKKKKRSEDAAATGEDQDTTARKSKKRQQANDTGEEQGVSARKKNRKQIDTDEVQSDKVSRADRTKIFMSLPTEKRRVFSQKLVSREVQRVHRNKLNFRIGVGVRVPRSMRFYPLPPDVVQFVPAYRGLMYFVTDDGLVVIIDPVTFEIVSVFPA